MGFFEKKVDRRSREEMTSFLEDHFSYGADNFRGGSYANNIKITNLGLSNDQVMKALDLMGTDELDDMAMRPVISDFTCDNRGYHTIVQAGRSGGYAVLAESYYKKIEHRSFCTSCGQRNFKHVPPELSDDANVSTIARVIWRGRNYNISTLIPLMEPEVAALEIDEDSKRDIVSRVLTAYREGVSQSDACGVCGEKRRDYDRVPEQLVIRSTTMDYDEVFDPEDWDMEDLRNRVNLVSEFDRACDQMRDDLIYTIDNCEVVEETVHIPTVRKRIEPRV